MIDNDLTKNIVNISFNELNSREIYELFYQRQKYNRNSFIDSFLIFLIKKKVQEVNIFIKKNLFIVKFIKSNIYNNFIKVNFIYRKDFLPRDCIIISKRFLNNEVTLFRYKKKYFVKNFFWPRLNFVSTNLDHGKYIERTIFSITKQNYQNYKIFVVDSVSKDNSHLILNNLKKKYHLNIFIRKDKNAFDGLNFFFKRKKIPSKEFVGVLAITDVMFEHSLYNIGFEILKNDNCVGIGGGCAYINKYEYKFNSKFYKSKFSIFEKKNLFDLKNIPPGQCFFFKFSYLLKSKSFSIGGCHTNTFILIILNALKNGKIILTTKRHLSGYIFHEDHSSTLKQSRGQSIFSSRVSLINEIYLQKLLDRQEVNKLIKMFQFQEFYYYLSHYGIEKNKILKFLKTTKLSIFELFVVLFKAIYGKLSYIYVKYC